MVYMFKIVIFFTMIIGVTKAEFIGSRYIPEEFPYEKPPFFTRQIHQPHGQYKTLPIYNFNYGVNDYEGNNYNHEETREGEVTKGSYHVDLPDGRRQIVTYYVDPYSGYVANVHYEGNAIYPTTILPCHYQFILPRPMRLPYII